MRRYFSNKTTTTSKSKSKSRSSDEINQCGQSSLSVNGITEKSIQNQNQGIQRSRSTLSLSMRYADPWLYDSVHGAPDISGGAGAGGYYQQAIISCTCKEYITGSKRVSKKGITVCKKCKGSRLPLVGGTCAVRAKKYIQYFDDQMTYRDYFFDPIEKPKRSETVRAAGYYSRPSVFSVIDDLQSAKSFFTNDQFCAVPTIPNRSQFAGTKTNRKSILECDINPYELVSDPNDDDNVKQINGQIMVVKSKKIELSSRISESKPTKSAKKEDRYKNNDNTNRFKSILKRQSSESLAESSEIHTKNMVDKLLNSQRRKGSVTKSSSSIKVSKSSTFYLPLPNNRKKVQFLVSSDDDDDDANGDCRKLKASGRDKCHSRKTDNSNKNESLATPSKALDLSRTSISSKADVSKFFDPPSPPTTTQNNKSVTRPKNPPPPPPPAPTQPEVLNQQFDPQLECEQHQQQQPPKPPPRKKNYQTCKFNNANKKALTVVYLTNEPKAETTDDSLVHKLQIKNELTSDHRGNITSGATSALKTSILINGDDCYSTVNVSNDVPLYQSSVVVQGDTGSESKCLISIGNADVDDDDDDTEEDLIRFDIEPDVVSLAETLVPNDHSNDDVNTDDIIDEPTNNGNIPISGNKQSSLSFYEAIDPNSDCYSSHSNRSSLTEDDLANRSKFYQLLADTDASLSDLDNHQYEVIEPISDNNQKTNGSNCDVADPIYEDIESAITMPISSHSAAEEDDDGVYSSRSIFEGASKYDILSYLVDAKERGVISDETYSTISLADDDEDAVKDAERVYTTNCWSTVSDSSEDSSLIITNSAAIIENGVRVGSEIERNDSGIGSESSKTSRSRYQSIEKLVLCEDCDSGVDPVPEDGPMICWRCRKRRAERKDIITEIVETEEKYGRDLQIVMEEFYQPMLVAGLLTPDQLSVIFLNVEELLDNSLMLAERLRDALDIAVEQGDEDLLTVNIGKIFQDSSQILHAFESYCVRQGAASLLLASLEKEKELLRIFLHVSQMENTLLRRMNLNSFLMVPVQRVTKYPLLLSRLYKVTPTQHESRVLLREAQHKVELHLNHINSETKDVPSKLWRRISNGSNRALSSEMDLINIKLRKIAVDVLEWNHEEAQFVLESRLFFTQPTDHHWRKGRMIKLASVYALLVTNGKANLKHRSNNQQPIKQQPEQVEPDNNRNDSFLAFLRKTGGGAREAALLLIRDKNGRYSLLRDPMYLDKCVIATDPAWQFYFEVQEVLGKDTYIFKAENNDLTKTWYRQLQLHAQGMGAWRKRRNALPNIMIYGMNSRSST